jgi:hypothetical protein
MVHLEKSFGAMDSERILDNADKRVNVQAGPKIQPRSREKTEANEPLGKEGAGDSWIKLSEAAKILGVDRGTAKRWADNGIIKDNSQEGKERRVLLSRVLMKKHSREKKELLKDAEELSEDAKKVPPQH